MLYGYAPEVFPYLTIPESLASRFLPTLSDDAALSLPTYISASPDCWICNASVGEAVPIPILVNCGVTGSLSLLIVPVVILAPSAKLVAVVAVPVKLPTKVVAVIIPDVLIEIVVDNPLAVPVRLPTKVVAVTTPVRLIPPVPVMNLPLISKLPPSWGVVSPTISVVIPVNEV